MAQGENKAIAQQVYREGVSYLDGRDLSDRALKEIAGWLDYYGRQNEGPSGISSVADRYHELADDVRELIDDDDAAAAASTQAAAEDAEHSTEQAKRGNNASAGRGMRRMKQRNGLAAGRRQGGGGGGGRRARTGGGGGGGGAPRGGLLAQVGALGLSLPRGEGMRRGARPADTGISDIIANLRAGNEAPVHEDAEQDLQQLLDLLPQLQNATHEAPDMLNQISMTPSMRAALLAALSEGAEDSTAELALSGLGGSSSAGTPLDPLSARVPGRQSVVLSGGTLIAAATTFNITVTMNTSVGGPYFLSFSDPSRQGYLLTSMTLNGTPVYVGPGAGVSFIGQHRIGDQDSRGLPIYIGQGFQDYNRFISECGCKGPWDVPLTVGSVLNFQGTLNSALAVTTPFGIQLACTPVGAAQGVAVGNGGQVSARDMGIARALLGMGGGGRRSGGRRSGLQALLGMMD
jgi:hypothetical protein